MRKMAFGALAVIALLAAYLLLWPLAVDPVPWAAPAPPGYSGPHAANDKLKGLTLMTLPPGESGPEHITTLIDSSAELSTLSRNIHRLTALLRQANVEPARPYREMLDTLADDVRRHLELAAHALADLQPRSRSAASSAQSSR